MADEVLVTEFRMTGNYASKVNDANQATKGFIGTQMDLQSVMKSGLAIVGIGAAAFVGGATALAGFANEASKAAAHFDTMERTFAGALGSLEKGRQMMAYLEQYATKSAFGLDDLTVAAKQLSATGLDVGRFLPIMERIALVASDIDPQGLIQVAGAFARIKGGSYGEAMEVLRKAGVSNTDLQNQGIKVSKGGEIQATAEQVFNAVQIISEGRLKSIADAISGGAENIRANVADVAGQAFRQVGKEVNDYLLPNLEEFTKQFKVIIDSGAIKTITAEFMGLLPPMNATSSVFEELAVTAAELPHILKTFGEGVMGVSKIIGDVFKAIPPLIPLAINEGMKATTGMDFITAAKMVYSSGAGDDVRRQIAEQKKKAMESVAAPTAEEAPPIDSPIAQTATNTAKMVDIAQKQLDISRQILGGGTVASEAASPVRIGQALGRGGQGSRVEQKLREFVREVYNETIGISMASQRNTGQPNRFGVR
jgi:hypothetical protein